MNRLNWRKQEKLKLKTSKILASPITVAFFRWLKSFTREHNIICTLQVSYETSAAAANKDWYMTFKMSSYRKGKYFE